MWKDVIGYEGLYEVSSDGQIRNRLGRILKCSNTQGYRKLNLTKDGKYTTYKVHRLVAQAFIANPKEYPAIDHIDEDKTNNNVDNLRWCSNAMNLDYHYDIHGKTRKEYKAPVYANMEAMVKATGKSIVVDGKDFISCGSAAQYIMDNIDGKNKATISKELRRFLQGKRSSWAMYERFTVGY